MKTLLSLLFIALTSLTLYAQPTGGSTTESLNASGFTGVNLSNIMGQELLNKAFNGTYEETKVLYTTIKGSPYLFDGPLKGTLTMKNGSKIKDVLLKVDLYTKEIIATINDQDIIVNVQHFTDITIPTDDNDIVIQMLNPEKPDNFYIVLYQDENLLFYKEAYATLKEGSNHGLAKTDSKFSSRKKYYIKNTRRAAKKVKLKKKKVFALFKKKEVAAMKEYAKLNKLKLKKEEDYVKVFAALKELPID